MKEVKRVKENDANGPVLRWASYRSSVLDRISSSVGTLRGLLILVAMLPALAFGATAGVNTLVEKTLTDASKFGGCMAKLTTPPGDTGIECSTPWVSFSCTGDFADKAAAQRNFDSAQLAAVLNSVVTVYVDDSKLHNGNCFAYRLVVSP